MHLDQIAVCAQSNKKVFEELIKVLLEFVFGHGAVRREMTWVAVYVGKQNSARARRLNMFSGASVTVSASADFKVKRAKRLVLLWRKGVRHGGRRQPRGRADSFSRGTT